MNLKDKSALVEELFESLEMEIRAFKSATRLGCKLGCSACCHKPDIEATPLEFLPFAFYLHSNNLANQWLDMLVANESDICILLNDEASPLLGGGCSKYSYRGLICRLFGFAAVTNKHGQKSLATCKTIKELHAASFAKTQAELNSGLPAPVISEYYMRLYSIDPALGGKYYPINEAIRLALEKVAMYFYYETENESAKPEPAGE